MTAAGSPARTRIAALAGWLRDHRVFLLVAFATLAVFPYTPAINNPNENVRVYMTRALVQHHTLDISKVEAEWGWVNDKARNGTRVFSSKAPGASLLGVPVLAAQTFVWHRLGWHSPSQLATTLSLRVFVVMIPMCAFLWLVCRHARRLSGSRAVGDLVMVAVGLGSLLYPYGIHFVGHGLAAAASFGAFMVLAPPPGGTCAEGHQRAAWAGLLAGLGVVFEYQNLLVAALLTVYVAIRRPRSLPAFLAGALPAVVILGTFHALCFGRPWAFPYGHLDNVGFQTEHHGRGFHGLGLPEASALAGVLFLPGFGFFACSPFLVVALAAVVWMVVRGPRAEGILLGGIAVVLTMFIAGLPNWRGGWSVGPRYIAAVVPFAAIALAYVWPRLAHRRWIGPAWTITAALVAVGVFLNALTAVLYPQVPTQLRNPAFQLLLPLPLDGYLPYSLAWALGMRGWASLVPVALAIAAAVVMVLPPPPRRQARVPLGRALAAPAALAIALALLVPFSRWPSHPSPAEKDAIRLVRSTWSPAPVRGAAPPADARGPQP